MKLHDLRPPDGSRTARTRVGRGIAAGKGKTAGRGTKGQKARAGGSIPPWFEGGQTPLHMRIPKLRGFRNRLKIVYEVVNVGDIGRAVDEGRLGGGGAAERPITVNQELLREAGLVRRLDRPLKILGSGEVSVALFVVADAFTKGAREKIEGAGGSANVLEPSGGKTPAIGLDPVPGESAAGETAAVDPTAEETEPPAEPALDGTDAAESADRPAPADETAEETEPPAEPASEGPSPASAPDEA